MHWWSLKTNLAFKSKQTNNPNSKNVNDAESRKLLYDQFAQWNENITSFYL